MTINAAIEHRAPEHQRKKYYSETSAHLLGDRSKESHSFSALVLWSSVVLRAEISFSFEDFRRVVRGVWGEALIQQHPSLAETIMNPWFRLCRAVFYPLRFLG
jgi:hypothetical protein